MWKWGALKMINLYWWMEAQVSLWLQGKRSHGSLHPICTHKTSYSFFSWIYEIFIEDDSPCARACSLYILQNCRQDLQEYTYSAFGKEKRTVIARVLRMIQLAPFDHCDIPIMASHGTWNLFYDYRKREKVHVEHKKIAVVDINGVIFAFVQVKKNLVSCPVWGDHPARVHGEISPCPGACEVFMPERRVHERFLRFKADMSVLDHCWHVVGSFYNALLDITSIATLVLNQSVTNF